VSAKIPVAFASTWVIYIRVLVRTPILGYFLFRQSNRTRGALSTDLDPVTIQTVSCDRFGSTVGHTSESFGAITRIGKGYEIGSLASTPYYITT